VPHELTWALEHPEDETAITSGARFRQCRSLVEVPTVLAELS
jgi:hypothetical protein